MDNFRSEKFILFFKKGGNNFKIIRESYIEQVKEGI